MLLFRSREPLRWRQPLAIVRNVGFKFVTQLVLMALSIQFLDVVSTSLQDPRLLINCLLQDFFLGQVALHQIFFLLCKVTPLPASDIKSARIFKLVAS